MSTQLLDPEIVSEERFGLGPLRFSVRIDAAGRREASGVVVQPAPIEWPRRVSRVTKRRTWKNVTFLVVAVMALLAANATPTLSATGADDAGAQATIAEPASQAASTRLIRSRPSKNFDAYVTRVESLTYIPGGDALWSTNDSRRRRNMAGMDPETQVLTQEINRGETFFGPRVGASSVNHRELETIANHGTNTLYVVNTVNNKRLCGDEILDLATIFELTRRGRSADFTIADWQLLPSANECPGNTVVSGYDAMVVIDGDIYFGSGNDVRRYDYQSNDFVADDRGEQIALKIPKAVGRQVRDMAYDGTHLWVLGYNRHGQWLAKFDWDTRELVGSQSLAEFDLTNPRGLAVKGNKLFIGENTADTEHNVHVFSIVK